MLGNPKYRRAAWREYAGSVTSAGAARLEHVINYADRGASPLSVAREDTLHYELHVMAVELLAKRGLGPDLKPL